MGGPFAAAAEEGRHRAFQCKKKERCMHVYVIPGANKGKSAFVFVYISQNVWLG